ncbi:MAG: hypothetical protein JSS82_12835 [Bacteroidetes bacterium]|nr:hypothetical protein [Bacteroidota bacterium]
MSSAPGAVIKKEISDIGELKNLRVQLAKTSNITTKDQHFLLARLAYDAKDTNLPSTKAAYLDIAGVDEMTRGFDQIRANLSANPGNGYSEITFKTRDGITGGYYSAKGGWAPFLRISDSDPDSYVFFEKEDQDKLMSLLDLCRQKLRPQPPTK